MKLSSSPFQSTLDRRVRGLVQNNYRQAVAAGRYDLRRAGLDGKHDHVRTLWEDQARRRLLRPHLQRRPAGAGDPLRVLDLGCGSGQGYELLARIDAEPGLSGRPGDPVLTEAGIEYVGADLSAAMVEKGRENFAEHGNVFFFQADLNEGLGVLSREPAFDLYFSSYGSFSHLSRARLKALLVDIGRHARPGAWVVLDLNGRYSIEWPGYWMARTEKEKVRDYTMNYLHLGAAEAMRQADHFPLRFWTGDEVRQLARAAGRTAGCEFRVLEQRDCSMLVGRHMDTAEYHPGLPPLRRLVNSLHQDFRRTDLEQLLLAPDLAGAHPAASPVLGELIRCWNLLVDFARHRLAGPVRMDEFADWSACPPVLQHALIGLDRVIADAGWIDNGDPRANLIEPQLAYLLRSLEFGLQRGIGCGHGHLVLLQVTR